MEDLTGKQLGAYRVIAPLGEGGMAAVYKAYQAGMDRYVALKILPRYFASDPQFVGRFEQEAKVLANLLHPHILPVHDYGEADGYTYIVMPFVESGTLADLLKGGPLPLPQMRRVISQVGDALDYAHSQGVIHRDVKPSNVLVDQRGNCLLTDFGIAKMVEGSIHLTRTGGIVGTPAYMSPEQIQGEALDGRSDVYSLGIMLYEMATGRPPYRAETPPAIFVKHLHDPLPPPRSLNAALPHAVERVILKALAKRREDRYPGAAEMVRALQMAIPDSLPAETAQLDQATTVFLHEEVAEEPRVEALGASEGQPLEMPATPAGPSNKMGAPPAAGEVPARRAAPPDVKRISQLFRRPTAVGVLAIALLLVLGLAIRFAFRPLLGVLDSRLAFVSDRAGKPAIYLMDDKGMVTQLTHSSASDVDPAWAPDKRRIAFASDRDGDWEIYWTNADGSGLTQVTNNNASDTEPAWSPGGDYIAFTSDRDGKREIYMAGPQGIARVTHSPGDAQSWEPAWGPQGSIFFTSDRNGKRDIYRTDEAGSVIRVTDTPNQAESWSPAWSWSGNYLAFASNRDGLQEIYILSEGGIVQRVSRTPQGQGSWQPICSSSGQFIAFTSDRGGRSEIYTITSEGTSQLTQSPGDGQSWSPAW
jgi:Tol biopolymer transport system component/predicted Ser/Thr protein kinase